MSDVGCLLEHLVYVFVKVCAGYPLGEFPRAALFVCQHLVYFVMILTPFAAPVHCVVHRLFKGLKVPVFIFVEEILLPGATLRTDRLQILLVGDCFSSVFIRPKLLAALEVTPRYLILTANLQLFTELPICL